MNTRSRLAVIIVGAIFATEVISFGVTAFGCYAVPYVMPIADCQVLTQRMEALWYKASAFFALWGGRGDGGRGAERRFPVQPDQYTGTR